MEENKQDSPPYGKGEGFCADLHDRSRSVGLESPPLIDISLNRYACDLLSRLDRRSQAASHPKSESLCSCQRVLRGIFGGFWHRFDGCRRPPVLSLGVSASNFR